MNGDVLRASVDLIEDGIEALNDFSYSLLHTCWHVEHELANISFDIQRLIYDVDQKKRCSAILAEFIPAHAKEMTYPKYTRAVRIHNFKFCVKCRRYLERQLGMDDIIQTVVLDRSMHIFFT